MVPSPSWPWRFWPQQYAVRSERTAQVWTAPAVTLMAGPGRARKPPVGDERSSVVPSPSWPKALSPQQRTSDPLMPQV